jgi:peroxiredoxin
MKHYLFSIALATLSSTTFAAAQVGEPAPDFKVTDATGKTRSLSEFKGKIVVLEWLNHGCPFVKKHYESGNMQKLQKEVTAQNDVVWLSVASSSEGQEGYMTGKETLAAATASHAAPTAILLDPAGTVGRAYEAKVTPHMFIIGKDGKVAYNGAIDDKPSTKATDVPTATNYILAALTEIKAGKPVSKPLTKPYGCSVKYKSL